MSNHYQLTPRELETLTQALIDYRAGLEVAEDAGADPVLVTEIIETIDDIERKLGMYMPPQRTLCTVCGKPCPCGWEGTSGHGG
jgi:hypothetical protein